MTRMFRPIPSLNGLYEISDDGILRNSATGNIIHGSVEKNGYRRVRIENKKLGRVIRTSIHQLVAEVYVENPDPNRFTEINHIDTNKLNNTASNLEWTDHSGNMKHAYASGINRRPLREHSEKTRRPVTNGEEIFESISEAAMWLNTIGRAKNKASGASGIWSVLSGKRKTFGGFTWKEVAG